MEPNELQVIPSSQRLAVLTELIAATHVFAAPTVMLYQNAVILSPSTVIANLTVADFDGYANVVGMTWESPYIDTDGSALVFGANQTILCTGSTMPNTIYGYALVNVGVTALLAAYAFAAPIGISASGQAVSFLPALRYSGT
jgi:hypothetical protein